MESYGMLVSEVMDEMNPRLLDFIKTHVITFTRWDLLRFLCENDTTQDTAENLAKYIGRAPDVIQREAGEMVAEGILESTVKGEYTVYRLTDGVDVRELVTSLVSSARERTFRMKLVYHILRAGGHG